MLIRDVLVEATARGLPFSVIALRGGELENDFRRSGRPFFLYPRNGAIDLRVVRAIKTLILDHAIEVVHCHQPVDGIHGYLAARGTQAKIVLTFHGNPKNQKWKDVAAARFLIRRVARNIAVSRAAREEISSSLGMQHCGRWSVLHNGVDVTRLQFESGNIREELGLPKDVILLGMVGNFQPGKDQMSLVKAFQLLHSHRTNDVHLILVGGKSTRHPSLFDECVTYVRHNGLQTHIHFLGPRADGAAITRQLDWFVFSTVGDTYALALVEAMMLGVPCIVAKTPPMVEVCGGEENVTFFSPSDALSLAERIRHVLTNSHESREKSIRARQWAMKNHTIEAHVDKLLTLYDEILSEPCGER